VVGLGVYDASEVTSAFPGLYGFMRGEES